MNAIGLFTQKSGYVLKSQYYIQETANVAILRSVNRIAEAMDALDPVRRKALLAQVDEISKSTQFKLIEIRDQTESVEKRQTSPLKLVRQILFVLGAFLIIVGKGLVIRHKYLSAPLS